MAKLSGNFASFLDDYRRQRPFYKRLASFVDSLIEGRLASRGIRAIVTSRAKSLDRLRGKLEELAAEKPDHDRDQIRSEIHDLAGVRVALYFPGDLDATIVQIQALIDENVIKYFPGERPNKYYRFPGYCATHFIATLRPSELEQIGSEYTGELFEIQVASVFMHAWSEVEHDLRYKPMTGPLSEDELSILESLNGLALAAETQLRQLQRAISRRTERSSEDIRNHYELAALLTALAQPDESRSRLPMGRADVLFLMLRDLQMLSPSVVEALYQQTSFSEEERSITDAIVEHLISDDPNRTAALASARKQAGENSPYDPRTSAATEDIRGEVRFLRLWQLADRTIAQLTGHINPSRARQALRYTLAHQLQGNRNARKLEGQLAHLDSTRLLRNQFVHEGAVIDRDILERESRLLIEFIRNLATLEEPPARRRLLTALRPLKEPLP